MNEFGRAYLCSLEQVVHQRVLQRTMNALHAFFRMPRSNSYDSNLHAIIRNKLPIAQLVCAKDNLSHAFVPLGVCDGGINGGWLLCFLPREWDGECWKRMCRRSPLYSFDFFIRRLYPSIVYFCVKVFVLVGLVAGIGRTQFFLCDLFTENWELERISILKTLQKYSKYLMTSI